MSAIYSDLRKHVQDAFREAGINLVSPHYIINQNFDGDKNQTENVVEPTPSKPSDK